MPYRSRLLVLAACLSWAGSLLAAENGGFTTSLFDGKSLRGWHVTGCEAVVENGAILLKSGNGLVRKGFDRHGPQQ